MSYNNDEGDLDSVVATFSDGTRGPLPDRVMNENRYMGLWHLADEDRLDGMGAWTNGLYVLDVNERTVTRTAHVFCDRDRLVDDTERIFEERWHEYLDWDGTGISRSGRSYGSEGSGRSSTTKRWRGNKRRR